MTIDGRASGSLAGSPIRLTAHDRSIRVNARPSLSSIRQLLWTSRALSSAARGRKAGVRTILYLGPIPVWTKTV